MLLAVVVPIFLLLASGYFTVKFKLLEQQQIAHIGAFVIKVALPAMFLHSIAAKDLNEIWSFEFLAIYAGVSLMLFTLAFILMSKHYAYATNQSAILALGAAMSNSALIGTAVLTLCGSVVHHTSASIPNMKRRLVSALRFLNRYLQTSALGNK